MHYLYFADEAAARGAADVVQAAGWELQNVAESASGGPEWSLSLNATARSPIQRPSVTLGRLSKGALSSGQAATTTGGRLAPDIRNCRDGTLVSVP